ncbi:hypothetical protein BGZ54_008768 [Gamsiella multidivaricata]|nr:hypothetical protein BGZ54_008768 [Gamsiella multidivaricata]
MTRALDLPEILLQVAFYLNAADVWVCSYVCRSFYSVFAPLVWRDLHFGTPCRLDPEQAPLARSFKILTHVAATDVSAPDRTADGGGQEPRNPFLETFQSNAPWVRSLTINNQDATLPLQLGMVCQQLESITIAGLSLDEKKNHVAEHWDSCKLMMMRNRTHLRSLTLVDWFYSPDKKAQYGRPVWNPILRCTRAWNLRSLRLENCAIRGKHLEAFWKVCERLETLYMDHTSFDLPLRPTRNSLNRADNEPTATNGTHLAPTPTPTESTPVQSTHLLPTTRFPRLKELTVIKFPRYDQLQIVNLLIAQCPELQSLTWSIYSTCETPTTEFYHHFAAGTWPKLDSIIIMSHSDRFTDEQYTQFLRAAKIPLRCLNLCVAWTQTEAFDLLKAHHFSTLETIIIYNREEVSNDWALEVLTSCPNLKLLKANVLHAQQFLKNMKPWVCLGLQELDVFINMGFPDNAPNRRLTEEEHRQCRAVFKQLATLRELRNLDMLILYPCLYTNGQPISGSNHPQYSLTALPMRLEAGLDELASLRRLQKISFWGGKHVVHRRELVWMVDHMKALKAIRGAWRTAPGKTHFVQDNFLRAGRHHKWLAERGINTDGCQIFERDENELDKQSCGECCALDQDIQEGDIVS